MEKSKSSGIGITGVLFIIFLVLKLTDIIDWSWWWVFSPIWIPICLVIGLAIIVILAVIIGLVIAVSLGYDINKLKNRFGDKS